MRDELLEYVIGYDSSTLMLRITEDDWTVVVWDDHGAYVLGDTHDLDRGWPHGIHALNLFTQEMTRRTHDMTVTHDEVRGLMRRAAADVPYACGIDWVPAEQRVPAILGYLTLAAHGNA